MAENLKSHFLQMMKTVNGLHAVVVTDRDGVTVLKVSDEQAPELAMRPRYLATNAMTMDQAGKLGVSSNKSIVSIYEKHQVISLNKPPFIVNLIASTEANTGLILSLDTVMNEALDDMQSAIDCS